MPHISHDDLAWRAAEGPVAGSALDAHLRDCVACTQELHALERTVRRIREDAVIAEPLPPALWDRIAAELDEDASPGDVAVASSAPPRARDRRARRASRRRFSARTLVAACVATALVVGGGVGLGAWVAQRPPAETVVASIALDPLASGLDAATASVVERDGHRVLVIDADALPSASGGTLDVWLIDADVDGMVNVGTLDADHAEYALPDDLDLEAFPIVDVSIEPLDGDPTHSGDSIWRGSLA